NEAQERYVLAIKDEDLKRYEDICNREYCPFAVLGKTTEEQKLKVTDSQLKSNAIDIPLDVVFGKPPKMTRKFKTKKPELKKLDIKMELSEAAEEVLKVPSVGSKAFLITIGDR